MPRLLILSMMACCVSAQLGLPFQWPTFQLPTMQPWGLDLFGAGGAAATTTEEPTTTEVPNKPTTTNGYQALGWETDDDGNIFWGNDIGKIYLIQAPAEKYWAPIPKDWPEGPLFGSLWPDSPNYRPLPPGYVIPGGIKTGIQVPFPPNTPKDP
ncbi:hypothetical protein PENTCL1PPCAC_14615 [Pristionchus entomophagus]|uniref:Uncharacterized protein n=1 Tax=Pristionchus entomophagus TaxID=358040 RepID=A0AAV5TBA7_9BILA|nr:hypothetical protein PENTCL1PPCAC_14615 [Pristionchus entomophagus]